MANRIHHMCIDVRGVLGCNKNMLKKLFVDNETGKFLTADEAREHLMDCLSEGKEVIPFGEPCEGFSYKTGCPGHTPSPQSGEIK